MIKRILGNKTKSYKYLYMNLFPMESFYQQPHGVLLIRCYYIIIPMIITRAIIAKKSKMLTHVGKGLFSTVSISIVIMMIN